MFDDAFWEGDVLNPIPTCEKGRGVKGMLDFSLKIQNANMIFIPMFYGVFAIRKVLK